MFLIVALNGRVCEQSLSWYTDVVLPAILLRCAYLPPGIGSDLALEIHDCASTIGNCMRQILVALFIDLSPQNVPDLGSWNA